MTPAALIPYCAYTGNMNITGEYTDSLSFPVCNQFKPTVLEGQLCYELDISVVVKQEKEYDGRTKAGKGKGILLVIDPGITKIENKNLQQNFVDIKGLLRTESESVQDTANIHIGSLVKFTDHRPGMYVMSSLKKMTGTDNFLALPDASKSCQIESLEECQTQRYIEKVRRECGCVPWSLSSGNIHNVSVERSQVL